MGEGRGLRHIPKETMDTPTGHDDYQPRQQVTHRTSMGGWGATLGAVQRNRSWVFKSAVTLVTMGAAWE